LELFNHLSDLRTALLLRARTSVAGGEVVSKAEACAVALTEAGILLAGGGGGARPRALLSQAGALLDELDENLLVLAHDQDRAVFAQLELLRERLSVLENQWNQRDAADPLRDAGACASSD
jgi:hypothetical protein